MYGHTFNLLYRDWIVDKLANREPLPEETRIFNQLLALQPYHIFIYIVAEELLDVLLQSIRDREDTILFYIAVTPLTLVSLLE